MAGETKPLIPEGSVSVAGREVEYSIIAALSFGILIGMILKS